MAWTVAPLKRFLTHKRRYVRRPFVVPGKSAWRSSDDGIRLRKRRRLSVLLGITYDC